MQKKRTIPDYQIETDKMDMHQTYMNGYRYTPDTHGWIWIHTSHTWMDMDTYQTHRQIQIQIECNDRVLYDNRGPVNRWKNTFYNHREHTAPTPL